jgi:hypothetical protein
MARIHRRICGACLILLLAATFAGCLGPSEAAVVNPVMVMPGGGLVAPAAVVAAGR